jgi:S1-C subfamily serine protease
MSGNAKFWNLFLVFYFIVITSSLGCSKRIPPRKVLDTEIPNYETELSDFKGRYTTKWVQPINKSEKCEMLFEWYSSDGLANQNGADMEWDGECKNGKAEGLGKITTTIGSITNYEVTYHNKGITDQLFYNWTQGTDEISFGAYVRKNNRMVKKLENKSNIKPNGDLGDIYFNGEMNLITGYWKGIGRKSYSDGHTLFAGVTAGLFFGTATAFNLQNKETLRIVGYYDLSVDQPDKFVIIKSNKRLVHQIWKFGSVKENVELPQSFIDSALQVSNEAKRASNAAHSAGKLAIAMKKKYDSLNKTDTSTSFKPKEPKPDKPRGNSTGTGFLISKMGHAITNAHVVQNCKKITIGDNANKQVPAELVNTDRNNDLALLKLSTLEMASAESKSLIQKLSIVVVPLASQGLLRSEDVNLGEKVLVAGYPFGDLFSNTIKVTSGVVSATRGLGDDSGEFQLDAAVQPGNSGGPIYDSSGNIVGVVVAQLDKLKMAKAIGSLPENVNFGIKASTVRQFLISSGLPSKKAEQTEEKSTQQLAEIAKNQALMVMCLN